jgi:hypothetical protein
MLRYDGVANREVITKHHISNHPYMIDQTATFDACLDFLDNWSDNGDYYGMTLYNPQEILVGQKDFTLLFIGSGNFPLVSYSTTGIHNISGK